MKNQPKKPILIFSLAVLAVVSAGCMIFFDVVGMRGTIDFLQGNFRIFTAFGMSSPLPRWFLFACLSGTLLVLCGYGLYQLKAQQKRYGLLILGLFLAIWLNFLCYAESVFFLAMTLVVAGLFALANIPPAIRNAITKYFATHGSTDGATTSSCGRQLSQMEWVRFFPLKRILAGCIWLFGLAFAIMGMIATYQRPDANSMAVFLVLLAVTALTARKVWRYVTTSCHCVPVLNQIFSKQEIEQLLMGETFTEFPLEDADLQTHMPILVSERWMFIGGLLISRQLLLGGTVLRRIATSGGTYRRSSRLIFFYLNGSKIQTHKTDFYLDPENAPAIKKALTQIAGISIPSSCNQALIEETYHAVLPELQDPKEKLRYLLTHDISEIKQNFAAVLAPNHEPHKKKRSQKAAERKR